jgi:hypothetical protein
MESYFTVQYNKDFQLIMHRLLRGAQSRQICLMRLEINVTAMDTFDSQPQYAGSVLNQWQSRYALS